MTSLNSSYEEMRMEINDAIFLNASLTIIVCNNDGKIIAMNPFGLAEFGYTQAELKDAMLEVLLPKRFREKHITHRNSYFRHPVSRSMGSRLELFAQHKDGTEFPVEISLGYFKKDNLNYVVAFVNNVSIRKEAEQALALLNDELEDKVSKRTVELTSALQELEQSKQQVVVALEKERELSNLKTRFVSTVSHEFRTPLSTILSSAYLVEKYLTETDQPKRQKHIQRIIHSVNILTDTLNDLLTVGKIEEGKIQTRISRFSIIEFINKIVYEMQVSLKDGQEIIYNHAGHELVFSDPGILRHIIVNLLSNAIKFSEKNCPIYVLSSVQVDDFLLSVKDRGIGISKEDQMHLTERFFRASNAVNIEGTGLGLHIVAKYATLLNGTMECVSNLNEGTEFRLTFQHRSA
jgi:PAS domain S-box-containing protein